MPPNHNHDEDDEPRFTAELDDRTLIRMSIPKLWVLITTIATLSFLAALSWVSVKTDLVEIRRQLWTPESERAVWKSAADLNPTLKVPDVDQIARQHR